MGRDGFSGIWSAWPHEGRSDFARVLGSFPSRWMGHWGLDGGSDEEFRSSIARPKRCHSETLIGTG